MNIYMKKISGIFLLGMFVFIHPVYIYSQTFTTSGNTILDPCSEVFIPRGVNYSLADDWNFPGNLNNGRELSYQIKQANPNTVRIQWYVDYGQPSRPALTLEGLDSVISRFAHAGIVSILELHDFTQIHTDTAAFNTTVTGWWTSAPVLALIDKHQSHLMVNIANEYGPVLYPAPNYTLNPNYASEIVTWSVHYKNTITRLRNAGIHVPLIIDGPNYGMDIAAITTYGSDFNAHDPLHRIVMSAHAYWNASAQDMADYVNQLSQLSVPVIFGEVGNVDFSCNNIEMDALLTACQNKNMGWLAWTWNRDECPVRNMTSNDPGNPNSPTDGMFNTLTTYGNTIVNNATYGLANHAVKADIGCLFSVSETAYPDVHLTIVPNPVTHTARISFTLPYFSNTLSVTVTDLYGHAVLTENHASGMNTITDISMDVSGLPAGVYFIQLRTGDKIIAVKKLIRQ